MEQCVLRETREETGFTVTITGLVGIYCTPKRDPRFRSMAITYMGAIVDGSMHGSSEGEPGWRVPQEVFGHMAFDCEDMLKDYLGGRQRIF